MTITELIEKVKTSPEAINFSEVIETIDDHYVYTPASFTNGDIYNKAGDNEGSCKIFAFGMLNSLDKQQTLNCFGKYYREDVLLHPENDDHANIRNFIKHDWNGITFESKALEMKK